MERAGRALSNAATSLDAQIARHKAQEEAAELKHVMNFVLAIARAAPLAPQAEADRLATASESFSSNLERVAFVAGDLKKVRAWPMGISPATFLYSLRCRWLFSNVPFL